MKASKLREMTVDELRNEARELSKQLFHLRLQKATGQLSNTSRLGSVRRDLARVNTVLTEKGRN
ncbi:MAG TPA: 50S ribosomal protein L29 [Acidobacteriota bacterium]|nr:50S ribosomal protein L29 [Acidobacteriota bacterium]